MSIQDAVRRTVKPGDRLPTPSERGVFEIGELTDESIVLLFGAERTPTRIPWRLVEKALSEVPSSGWMQIGAVHASESPAGSFEALLKPALQRSTANYVAALLERAGALDIDRGRPQRVRRRIACS